VGLDDRRIPNFIKNNQASQPAFMQKSVGEGMRISSYPYDGMAAMGHSDRRGDDNKSQFFRSFLHPDYLVQKCLQRAWLSGISRAVTMFASLH
jgi:hypothetical protein